MGENLYIHTHLVNIVYKFERNPLKTLGEIAIFANCGRRTDGRRTDDGRIAMTKAHHPPRTARAQNWTCAVRILPRLS